jgi:hypothetical protein
MSRTFKLTYVVLAIILLGTNSAEAYTKELALQTARETWWYFKQVINKPNSNQTKFSVKIIGNKWITDVKWVADVGYSGKQLLEDGILGDEEIIKDSLSIIDWAFVENKQIIGAFSYRIGPHGEDKKDITSLLGARLVNYQAVGDDFLNRSKRPGSNIVGDSTSLVFLNNRFDGGVAGFYKYLSSTISYPPFAREIGLQGYCYVSFTVSPAGLIEDVLIEQTIGGGSYFECQNVMNQMPDFKSNDISSKTRFTLPIKLVLN